MKSPTAIKSPQGYRYPKGLGLTRYVTYSDLNPHLQDYLCAFIREHHPDWELIPSEIESTIADILYILGPSYAPFIYRAEGWLMAHSSLLCPHVFNFREYISRILWDDNIKNSWDYKPSQILQSLS